MHRRMAGGAEADKVLRRIRAAFALWQDVMVVFDGLAAQGAPAILQGGDIVFLACIAFQASVLEVPATDSPVLQLHEGEAVVFHRPVRDGQELADATYHAEMRLHALPRCRRKPASRTPAVVEAALGIDDVLQRQDAILIARKLAPLWELGRRAVLFGPALAAEAFAPAGSTAVAGTVFHELRDFLVPAGNMCRIHDFALAIDDGFANVGAARVGSAVKRLPVIA